MNIYNSLLQIAINILSLLQCHETKADVRSHLIAQLHCLLGYGLVLSGAVSALCLIEFVIAQLEELDALVN